MRWAAGLALAVLAGCVTLGPRVDATRYYVLEPDARRAEPDRPAVAVLGVGPVALPAYLDRPEIVTRAGPARLEVATIDRWAAPLEVLFASALAEDLRAAVPVRGVLRWPWPAGASPEWSVSVEVLRFEREPDGTAVLEGRWTLRRLGKVAREGLTVARERSGSAELGASVVALSRTVGALARDIARAVDAGRPDAASATTP